MLVTLQPRTVLYFQRWTRGWINEWMNWGRRRQTWGCCYIYFISPIHSFLVLIFHKLTNTEKKNHTHTHEITCICLYTIIYMYVYTHSAHRQLTWPTTLGTSMSLIIAYVTGYTEALLIPALAWLLFKQTSQKSQAACHGKETIYVRFWAGESVRVGEEGGGELLKVERGRLFMSPTADHYFQEKDKVAILLLWLAIALTASFWNPMAAWRFLGGPNESGEDAEDHFASSLDGCP